MVSYTITRFRVRQGQQDLAADTTAAEPSEFIPTRRVREAPGGRQTLQLFEGESADDALAAAPSGQSVPAKEVSFSIFHTTRPPVKACFKEVSGTPIQDESQASQGGVPGFKPTRHVVLFGCIELS